MDEYQRRFSELSKQFTFKIEELASEKEKVLLEKQQELETIESLKSSEIGKTQEELEALHRRLSFECQQFSKFMEQATQQRIEAQNELEQCRIQLQTVTTEKNEQIALLEKQSQLYIQQIQDLQAQLSESRQSLELEVSALKSACGKSQSEKLELENSLALAKTQATEREEATAAELARVTEELEKLQTENENLQSQLVNSTEVLLTLQETSETLIQDLQKAESLLETKSQSESSQLTYLQNHIDELQSQLSSKDEQFNELTEQYQQGIANNAKKIESLLAEKQLERETELQQLQLAHEKKTQELEALVQQSKSKIEQLEKEITTNSSSTEAKLLELAQNVDRLTKEKVVLEKTLSDRATQLQEMEKMLQKLKKEMLAVTQASYSLESDSDFSGLNYYSAKAHIEALVNYSFT